MPMSMARRDVRIPWISAQGSGNAFRIVQWTTHWRAFRCLIVANATTCVPKRRSRKQRTAFMQSKIRHWQFWASRATFLIMMSAVLPGCGATMKPVQPGQRFEFDGISVQPPEGDNWYYTERNNNGFWTLNFNQRIDDKTPGQRIGRSVFLYVESGHFNPLKPGQTQHEQLAETFPGASSPNKDVRFRDVVNTTSWMHVDGQEAMRVYRVAEDHDHPVESHSVLNVET